MAEKTIAENMIELNSANFDEIRKSNNKIVLDCWADWCGPCRMLAPTIDKLARDYSGEVTFAKMDCDKNQNLVQQFRIMAIPTILFFKDGEVVDQIIGLVPREEIEAVMKRHF